MDRDALKKAYIKSKLYRSAAWVLAAGGLLVFIFLYIKVTGGNFMLALQNPHFVLFILMSFLPAAFMAFLADRLQRQTLEKFEEMIKDQDG